MTRLGRIESLRSEEKAFRASNESPLRDRSWITAFHEKMLVGSTYLLKSVVRFVVAVSVVNFEIVKDDADVVNRRIDFMTSESLVKRSR